MEQVDGAGIGNETTKSFGVASWILLSRVTGLLRVAVAGAILGPTFFANIFQATNMVPNITYNLLAGSVLTSLIVPLLVEALEGQGIDRARQLLRRLMGVVIAGFLAAAIAVTALSPVIVHLLTVGVDGGAASARARTECWVLLFLVLPQIALYGIVAVAVAAQNARERFALAAAAPAFENIGLIVTLVLVWRIFGSDTRNVSNGYLLFLGVGATLSVALHTALQCFGAARAGLPLWPGWGWHDPAVRALSRRLLPAVGTATLDAGWYFVLMVAAGTVAGGVVAMQIGVQFYYLPVALSSKAVGAVLLPRLSREALQDRLTDFRETYDRGISWAWFVAVPASLALLVSAKPLAQALAFGEMRHGNGIALLTASIAGLALAIIGNAMYDFAKQACYARHDVIPPLVVCAAMFGLVLVGAPLAAMAFNGPAVLAGIGVVVTFGEFVRAFVCDRAARRGTHASSHTLARSLGRHIVTAAVTIGPGALLGRALQNVVGGHIGAVVGVSFGVAVGMIGYIAVQAFFAAPELPPNRLSARRKPPGSTASTSR